MPVKEMARFNIDNLLAKKSSKKFKAWDISV
jgi:hypothetical protein